MLLPYHVWKHTACPRLLWRRPSGHYILNLSLPWAHLGFPYAARQLTPHHGAPISKAKTSLTVQGSGVWLDNSIRAVRRWRQDGSSGLSFGCTVKSCPCFWWGWQPAGVCLSFPRPHNVWISSTSKTNLMLHLKGGGEAFKIHRSTYGGTGCSVCKTYCSLHPRLQHFRPPISLTTQMSSCSFAADILPLKSSGIFLAELHVGLYNSSLYLFIEHKLFYCWV